MASWNENADPSNVLSINPAEIKEVVTRKSNSPLKSIRLPLPQKQVENFADIFLEASRLFKINSHMLDQQSKAIDQGNERVLFSHESQKSKKVWLSSSTMARAVPVVASTPTMRST